MNVKLLLAAVNARYWWLDAERPFLDEVVVKVYDY